MCVEVAQDDGTFQFKFVPDAEFLFILYLSVMLDFRILTFRTYFFFWSKFVHKYV